MESPEFSGKPREKREKRDNGLKKFGVRFNFDIQHGGGKPSWPDWLIAVGTIGAAMVILWRIVQRVLEIWQ